MLDAAGDVLRVHYKSSGGRKGQRGHPPGRQWGGGGIRRAWIWNSEIWSLLANCYLYCRQWYFTSLIPPNTAPVLGPDPQLSVVHDPTQSSVYTKKLHCWSDWSFTCCKLHRRSIFIVQLMFYTFTGNRNSMFCNIHAFPNSVQNLKIMHEIWSLDLWKNL